MITYSSAKFNGAENKSSMTIKVRDAVSSAALITFLKIIEGASQASLISSRFEVPEASPVAPNAACVLGRVAHLTLKDDNGQLSKVTVPGVDPAFIEEHPTNKKNQVLSDAKCTAIATGYGTATGKTGVVCLASRIHQDSYK